MAVGMAIFAVASAAMQYSASQKAAGRQEDLSRENARLLEMETEETVRRDTLEAAKIESSSRARAAASGITLGGSTGLYLSEQQRANKDRIRWLKKSGKSRADIIEREGAGAASTTRAQGIASAVGSIGNAYGYWSQK